MTRFARFFATAAVALTTTTAAQAQSVTLASYVQRAYGPSTSSETADVRAAMQMHEGSYHFADGSAIEIEARADGLHVTPDGQQAYEALRIAPVDESLRDMNGRTERLLAAWSSNDLAPIVEAVAPARRERAEKCFARLFSMLDRELGHGVTAQVQGTLPADHGRANTFVQLKGSRAEVLVRFIWKDGFLFSVQRASEPNMTLTAIPVSHSYFAVLNGIADEPTWMIFHNGENVHLQTAFSGHTYDAQKTR